VSRVLAETRLSECGTSPSEETSPVSCQGQRVRVSCGNLANVVMLQGHNLTRIQARQQCGEHGRIHSHRSFIPHVHAIYDTHRKQHLLKAVDLFTVPHRCAVSQLRFVIRSGRKNDASVRAITSQHQHEILSASDEFRGQPFWHINVLRDEKLLEDLVVFEDTLVDFIRSREADFGVCIRIDNGATQLPRQSYS
jgi:hypothetical protein